VVIPGSSTRWTGSTNRITADPVLAGYFPGVDQSVLRAHQVDLLAEIAGGPRQYTGRALATAHRHLNVTDPDFDRVLGHLNAALVEAGADAGTIRGVLTAIEAMRGEVVTAQPSPNLTVG
jgi:hemoglobin